MAAKKKPSFYHVRKKICNHQIAAEILGVDVAEVERMDQEGAPVYAERLLLMWDRSQIRAPGWEDWRFIRGALVYKNKRWRPENLLHHWNNTERLEQLESEICKLQTTKGLIRTAKKLIKDKIDKAIYRYASRKIIYTYIPKTRSYR